jgi:SAM-dependent methyltransferase
MKFSERIKKLGGLLGIDRTQVRQQAESGLKSNTGYCPICAAETMFIEHNEWLRDYYKCAGCASIPRFRALIDVLETYFPQWRELTLHESSPAGAASDKLQRECRNYTPTHFFPAVMPGEIYNGFRCENLEAQTFSDSSFDLVITQDVMEHLLHPDRALSEIARTLKPGGAHVFTVPWFFWKKTLARAVEENGKVKHQEPPDYHCNPFDDQGSLVIDEWEDDLIDYIYRACGLTTTVVRIHDRSKGIDAQFIEVFISQKRL